MAQVDTIRNGIIDRLMSITDKKYLLALQKFVEDNNVEKSPIRFTKEQKLMLEMSETDLKHDRTISQSDLDKEDLEWLKGK